MIPDIALWCTSVALAGAVAVAAFWVRGARRLRARVAGLEEACAARDDAVARLAAIGLPSPADLMTGPHAPLPTVAIAPGLEGTSFARALAFLADRYTAGLRDLQLEMAEAVRQRERDEARQTTESAVRSFAETVVSLGANLSKVVGQAMREHRGNEMFETLTLIDHTVQQMIRQAQSYVVVCGGLPGRRWPAQSMTDVVRGAMGRIQDYQRIRPRELERQVVGQAVEPAVHAVATLLDNAARYSPPGSFVDVTFQEGHHGVTVIVDDAGVGMNSEQLDSARRILSGEEPVDLHRFGPHPKIGFPTVAALSRRYGFQATIDGSSSPFGGTRAALFIPEALLASDNRADQLAPRTQAASPARATVTASPAPDPAQPRQQEPAPAQPSAPGPRPAEVVAVTDAGLPRRRRHSATTDTEPLPPVLSDAPPRPSIAAAWQNGAHNTLGAQSGHSFPGPAAPSDPAEGTR